MKKVGGIREKFLTKEKIEEAIGHLTGRSKSRKWTMATKKEWKTLLKDKEGLVNEIYIKLLTRTYVFKKFKIFNRNESRKVRHIYASHVKDQIVDYILDECLKYVFLEKKKIVHPNCYGSIKGKGQHELRKRIMNLVRGSGDLYIATCDTKQYYPTVNHEILMQTVEKHIKDPWVLWLTKATINRMPGGRGLALGLATSNILGHIYHAEVDWIVTQKYKFKNYFRFCDDKIMISNDKNLLHTMIRVLRDLVESKHDQTIKSSWKVVRIKKQRVELLGAMIGNKGARISSYKRRRIERKFKKEMSLPFSVEKDCDRVLRMWGGIKGGLKDIDVRNLIKWWVLGSPFKEFFLRLRTCMMYVENGRKQHI